jgi:glycosyltransferase involved in cell wall biosynthesis
MRLPDIIELFLNELQSRGVKQTWYCGPPVTSGRLRLLSVGDAEIIVPPSLDGGLIGKVATWLMNLIFETVYLVKQLWCRPDAILIRDKYWGAVVGYLVARACGIPFLVWLSYPYPQHYREEAARVKGWKRYPIVARSWLGFKMLYPMMRRADHCFVQSEQMMKDLEIEESLPPWRMTAVPMGAAKRLADELVHVTPANPPTVVYLGNMAAIRRLDVLVEAFALASRSRPDVHFMFIGDGDVPSERRDLEARAALSGLTDQVTFTGQIPQVEALMLVRHASVCVSPVMNTPALRVASPTKLIEYLALGKATVANDHPEHSMIARKSKGLSICDWSAASFAAHIIYLLNHPEEARRMGDRGRQWVQQNRTYDRLADMVYGKLESLVLRSCDSRESSWAFLLRRTRIRRPAGLVSLATKSRLFGKSRRSM